MSKSTFFTGQPIFTQLLHLVPRDLISRTARQANADRYCKRFNTYDHLVTLLYSIFNNCNSLREVTTGMLACGERLSHLGLKHFPRRSTISDAGKRRSADVFEQIYYELIKKHAHFLSDSRHTKKGRNLYIFDSTTISLFQEVLRGSGLKKANGKQKGGIKVHTLIRSDQDVPCMIRMSDGVANDVQFLKQIRLPEGSIIVFDKGYRDYTTYNRFDSEGITWVTALRKRTTWRIIKARQVKEEHKQQGVIEDEEVMLGHTCQKDSIKVSGRLISYADPVSGEIYRFLTNNLKMSPLTIAEIYKKRWQIESLFKRLKQNYPLKYFLGDSENAIKTQIWCVLIADLLLNIIKKGPGAKWSFSNLASMVRIHLMTYIQLKDFLRSPEKSLLKRMNEDTKNDNQGLLFKT